jgi:ABC-2 type transport system ATP-binding protein
MGEPPSQAADRLVDGGPPVTEGHRVTGGDVIRTRALTKDFTVGKGRVVRAVRGITLTVEPGELVAVLGPNGAGKSTTMRMLATLIAPTSGSATVAGFDVVADAAQVRRRIGYVGQGNAAGHHQKVRDELYSQGLMYGLRRHDARRRADELLAALDLTELADRKVSALSGGQRRRLDVAMGLVHAPSPSRGPGQPFLLFLDEPTTGLDPHNRANLWAHIDRMRREREMTVVLTTHYLDEADAMTERVVVVDHGEIIADDTADSLKAKLAGDRITVTAADPGRTAELAELVAKLPGARDVTVARRTTAESTVDSPDAADTVQARVDDGPSALPELTIAAHQAGIRIAATQVFRPTLDDVFLNLTGRSLRDGEATDSEESQS